MYTRPSIFYNRGRVLAESLKVGDVVKINTRQYSEEKVSFDKNEAWLLGFILCKGSYNETVSSSIAFDTENDIEKAYIDRMKECFNSDVKVIESLRGTKGTYKDLVSVGSVTHIIDYLSTKFEGLTK